MNASVKPFGTNFDAESLCQTAFHLNTAALATAAEAALIAARGVQETDTARDLAEVAGDLALLVELFDDVAGALRDLRLAGSASWPVPQTHSGH